MVAPALPAGWTTTSSGLGTPVTTSTIFPDTAPNDVFLSEASNVALSEVASSTIALAAGGASRLTFRNLYNTEPGFDGGSWRSASVAERFRISSPPAAPLSAADITDARDRLPKSAPGPDGLGRALRRHRRRAGLHHHRGQPAGSGELDKTSS